MPIYAYRCATCGHAQDVLQKISDPLLTVCPACGASTYVKQVTAAGFQLKGSGWYVTDFRGGDKKPAKSGEGESAAGGDKADKGAATTGSDSGAAGDVGGKKSDAAPAAAPAPSASGTAPAPSPAPAASSPPPPSTPSGKSGKSGS